MQQGGEGWQELSRREGCSTMSGVWSSVCHHNGIKREKEKSKKKGNEGKLQIFLSNHSGKNKVLLRNRL